MRILRLLMVVLAPLVIDAAPSVRLHLSGSVRSKDQQTSVSGLHIFVKAEGRVLADTKVDTSGHYAISFIPEDQSFFDFYCVGNGMDTTFIRSFTQFESDVMTWDIELP